MARNLCEAFKKRALRRKGDIAIQCRRQGHWVNISYGELLDNISAFSSVMRSCYGVKSGDRVAIALGNTPEWPILFFAILDAGAIAVPVNAQGSSKDIENILSDAGCGVIFTEGLRPLSGVECVSVDSDEFKRNLPLRGKADSYPAKRDDTACIMYTSGTTSHPKGVMLSHGNLLSNTYSLYKLGLMHRGDGIISVLPLYHTYAMAATTIAPLIYGGRVVYPGTIKVKEVMAAMKESKAELFIGVPLIFEMFHKTIKDSLDKLPGVLRFLINAIADGLFLIREKTGINLARYFFYGIHLSLGKSMRVYMSGGAKLNEDAERGMFKFGFTILNGYGMTETSPVLSVNPPDKPKIGSVGLPLKNVEVRINSVDENGIGEIFVRGPNVMKGYYKNDTLTRSIIEDGWLRTKDIGYLDKDGYLFIVGRVDDAITLGNGLSISPDELEDVYSVGTAVKEICVFDAPSSNGKTDASAIWAVVAPDMELLGAKGITDPYYYLKTAFEKVSRTISIPERLMGFSVTLDALPRTLMGKVMRREVKRRYISGQIKEAFHPGEKMLTKEDISILQKPEARQVVGCLRDWTQAKEISPSDSFELDLGIDLIGRSELAFELDRKLGFGISEDEINNVFTVGELIERVEKAGRRMAMAGAANGLTR